MPIVDQEGTYRAKVISKEFCKSSNGSEQLAVGFEVTQDCSQIGHHLVEFLSFSDAALEYTEKKMRTMGWEGVDLNDLSTLGNNEVEIVCQIEEYNGKERMRVKFINPIGGMAMNITPLDDNEKRAFAARMKAKFAALNANAAKAKPAARPAAKPAQQSQRPEPPPPTDSDIPF